MSVTTGSITIIDRSGSLEISRSTTRARGKLCDIQGFFPMNTETLGVLELTAGVAAVERVLDPTLAGLLLGQGARAVAGAERAQEGAAVGAAEVVALAAAAVVEDRLAPVLVADALEARGDLCDRGVPVDLFVAAVRPAPHRRREAVGAVLVMVETHRLVAGVALGSGVRLVAADLVELAPVELHLDAAVALAEDAGGLLPGCLFDGHASTCSSSACTCSLISWQTLSSGARS